MESPEESAAPHSQKKSEHADHSIPTPPAFLEGALGNRLIWLVIASLTLLILFCLVAYPLLTGWQHIMGSRIDTGSTP